jgi:hypothetical protein
MLALPWSNILLFFQKPYQVGEELLAIKEKLENSSKQF